MSALPPKADMVQHRCNVRYVPKADIRIGSDYLDVLAPGWFAMFTAILRA